MSFNLISWANDTFNLFPCLSANRIWTWKVSAIENGVNYKLLLFYKCKPEFCPSPYQFLFSMWSPLLQTITIPWVQFLGMLARLNIMSKKPQYWTGHSIMQTIILSKFYFTSFINAHISMYQPGCIHAFWNNFSLKFKWYFDHLDKFLLTLIEE